MFNLRKTLTQFTSLNEDQGFQETMSTVSNANSRSTAVVSKTKSIQDEMNEIIEGGIYPDLSEVFHKLMKFNGQQVGNSEFDFPVLAGHLER